MADLACNKSKKPSNILKISIITIVYNNAECIVDCLKSVQAQSYEEVEHVVIDGGSTDGTQDLIAPYVDSLGYYISEPDKGLYNALNKGIEQCTGDVIGILHSDDIFYNDYTIADIATKFETKKADLVYANGLYVERDNPTKIRRIYKSKPFKNSYLRFGWIPLHTTIFVKKTVFDSYGLYNEGYRIASDYDISLRWFLESKIKKVFLDRFLVKMRLGGKSTSLKLQKTKSVEDFKIIKKYHLWGLFTLALKIARKIPQYLRPLLSRSKN